ncbi:MAG: response regulator [Candidatus Omnitrophica bacterium]|nr:response regulator [Candidatus Omnitrophota bacterium]
MNKNILKNRPFLRAISLFVILAFGESVLIPQYVPKVLAQSALGVPSSGAVIHLSQPFTPVIFRGLKVFPKDPLRFDFIVDRADSKLEKEEFKSETEKLIRYFLASLTIPEKDLWVNLSPYEQDRIIPRSLGKTEMGKDMLAQDYLLKQITASLIHPEGDTGKKFWQRVYSRAYQEYGTTEIPVDTFNKVWIMPQKAVVYEFGDRAFVLESKLKVMLETDYLAMQEDRRERMEDRGGVPILTAGSQSKRNKFAQADLTSTQSLRKSGAHLKSKLASDIIRDIVIPELESEVNFGENFAQLRQIYHSMILAAWFKKKLKGSILNQVYADQNKIKGVDLVEENVSQEIYDQYLQAFKKGVCDFIKVEHDPYTNKNIPRKYFSGGIEWVASSNIEYVTNISSQPPVWVSSSSLEGVDLNLKPVFDAPDQEAGSNIVDLISALSLAGYPQKKNQQRNIVLIGSIDSLESAIFLSNKFPKSIIYVVEEDEQFFEELKKQLKEVDDDQNTTGIQLIHAHPSDVSDSLANEMIDLVLMDSHVDYYGYIQNELPDILKEIKRILKPKGIFCADSISYFKEAKQDLEVLGFFYSQPSEKKYKDWILVAEKKISSSVTDSAQSVISDLKKDLGQGPWVFYAFGEVPHIYWDDNLDIEFFKKKQQDFLRSATQLSKSIPFEFDLIQRGRLDSFTIELLKNAYDALLAVWDKELPQKNIALKNYIPQVMFDMSIDDDSLIISVYDNGIGDTASREIFTKHKNQKANEGKRYCYLGGGGWGLIKVQYIKSLYKGDFSLTLGNRSSRFTHAKITIPLSKLVIKNNEKLDKLSSFFIKSDSAQAKGNKISSPTTDPAQVVSSGILLPVDIEKEKQGFISDWNKYYQDGLGAEKMKLMVEKSKGVMSIYDFIKIWMVKSKKTLGGYSLGINEESYFGFCDLAGLTNHYEGYKEMEITFFGNPDHRYIQKISATGKPIVFFIPKNIFTYSDNYAQHTKTEMRYLLENFSYLENVYFVFGAYEIIPQEYEEEWMEKCPIRLSGREWYAKLIEKVFSDVNDVRRTSSDARLPARQDSRFTIGEAAADLPDRQAGSAQAGGKSAANNESKSIISSSIGVRMTQEKFSHELGRPLSEGEWALVDALWRIVPSSNEQNQSLSIWKRVRNQKIFSKKASRPRSADEDILDIFRKMDLVFRGDAKQKKDFIYQMENYVHLYLEKEKNFEGLEPFELLKTVLAQANQSRPLDRTLIVLSDVIDRGLIKSEETIVGIAEKFHSDPSQWKDIPDQSSKKKSIIGRKPVVLLVDDNPGQIRELKVSLENAGYDVDFAMAPETGLKKIEESIPDLIVTDWEMAPFMDGITFIKRLKKSYPDIPVVFRSGDVGDGDDSRSMRGSFILAAFDNVVAVSGKFREEDVAFQKIQEFVKTSSPMGDQVSIDLDMEKPQKGSVYVGNDEVFPKAVREFLGDRRVLVMENICDQEVDAQTLSLAPKKIDNPVALRVIVVRSADNLEDKKPLCNVFVLDASDKDAPMLAYSSMKMNTEEGYYMQTWSKRTAPFSIPRQAFIQRSIVLLLAKGGIKEHRSDTEGGLQNDRSNDRYLNMKNDSRLEVIADKGYIVRYIGASSGLMGDGNAEDSDQDLHITEALRKKISESGMVKAFSETEFFEDQRIKNEDDLIEALNKHSQGVFDIREFKQREFLEDVYAFGPRGERHNKVVEELGFIHYMTSLEPYNFVFSHLIKKLIQEKSKIVFFVGRNLDQQHFTKLTTEELRLLFDKEGSIENVYFVFGLYDPLPNVENAYQIKEDSHDDVTVEIEKGSEDRDHRVVKKRRAFPKTVANEKAVKKIEEFLKTEKGFIQYVLDFVEKENGLTYWFSDGFIAYLKKRLEKEFSINITTRMLVDLFGLNSGLYSLGLNDKNLKTGGIRDSTRDVLMSDFMSHQGPEAEKSKRYFIELCSNKYVQKMFKNLEPGAVSIRDGVTLFDYLLKRLKESFSGYVIDFINSGGNSFWDLKGSQGLYAYSKKRLEQHLGGEITNLMYSNLLGFSFPSSEKRRLTGVIYSKTRDLIVARFRLEGEARKGIDKIYENQTRNIDEEKLRTIRLKSKAENYIRGGAFEKYVVDYIKKYGSGVFADTKGKEGFYFYAKERVELDLNAKIDDLLFNRILGVKFNLSKKKRFHTRSMLMNLKKIDLICNKFNIDKKIKKYLKGICFQSREGKKAILNDFYVPYFKEKLEEYLKRGDQNIVSLFGKDGFFYYLFTRGSFLLEAHAQFLGVEEDVLANLMEGNIEGSILDELKSIPITIGLSAKLKNIFLNLLEEEKENKKFSGITNLKEFAFGPKRQVLESVASSVVTLRDGSTIPESVYRNVRDALGLPDNRNPEKKYFTIFQGGSSDEAIRILSLIASKENFNKNDFLNLAMGGNRDLFKDILRYLAEKNLVVFSGKFEDNIKFDRDSSLSMDSTVALLIRASIDTSGDPFRGTTYFAFQDPLSQDSSKISSPTIDLAQAMTAGEKTSSSGIKLIDSKSVKQAIEEASPFDIQVNGQKIPIYLYCNFSDDLRAYKKNVVSLMIQAMPFGRNVRSQEYREGIEGHPALSNLLNISSDLGELERGGFFGLLTASLEQRSDGSVVLYFEENQFSSNFKRIKPGSARKAYEEWVPRAHKHLIDVLKKNFNVVDVYALSKDVIHEHYKNDRISKARLKGVFKKDADAIWNDLVDHQWIFSYSVDGYDIARVNPVPPQGRERLAGDWDMERLDRFLSTPQSKVSGENLREAYSLPYNRPEWRRVTMPLPEALRFQWGNSFWGNTAIVGDVELYHYEPMGDEAQGNKISSPTSIDPAQGGKTSSPTLAEMLVASEGIPKFLMETAKSVLFENDEKIKEFLGIEQIRSVRCRPYFLHTPLSLLVFTFETEKGQRSIYVKRKCSDFEQELTLDASREEVFPPSMILNESDGRKALFIRGIDDGASLEKVKKDPDWKKFFLNNEEHFVKKIGNQYGKLNKKADVMHHDVLLRHIFITKNKKVFLIDLTTEDDDGNPMSSRWRGMLHYLGEDLYKVKGKIFSFVRDLYSSDLVSGKMLFNDFKKKENFYQQWVQGGYDEIPEEVNRPSKEKNPYFPGKEEIASSPAQVGERVISLDDYSKGDSDIQGKAGQSAVYFSEDGKHVLKIFNKDLVKKYVSDGEISDAHVVIMAKIILNLSEEMKRKFMDSKIKIVVPELVRIKNGPLALLSKRIKGGEPSFLDRGAVKKISEFRERISGLLAFPIQDRRELDYTNFLIDELTGQIYCIDLIDMISLFYILDQIEEKPFDDLDRISKRFIKDDFDKKSISLPIGKAISDPAQAGDGDRSQTLVQRFTGNSVMATISQRNNDVIQFIKNFLESDSIFIKEAINQGENFSDEEVNSRWKKILEDFSKDLGPNQIVDNLKDFLNIETIGNYDIHQMISHQITIALGALETLTAIKKKKPEKWTDQEYNAAVAEWETRVKDYGFQAYITLRAIELAAREEKISSVFINQTTGGIDFDRDNWELETRGEGIEFEIPAELQGVNFDEIQGFVPVIINIVPITNILLILGLSEKDIKNLKWAQELQVADKPRELSLL